MSDDRLARDLVRLTARPKTVDPLSAASAPAPLLGKTGLGTLATPSGTAGIASPVSEPDYAAREWYDERDIVSSDGLFTIKARRIKKIVMRDAALNPFELSFADEPA